MAKGKRKQPQPVGRTTRRRSGGGNSPHGSEVEGGRGGILSSDQGKRANMPSNLAHQQADGAVPHRQSSGGRRSTSAAAAASTTGQQLTPISSSSDVLSNASPNRPARSSSRARCASSASALNNCLVSDLENICHAEATSASDAVPVSDEFDAAPASDQNHRPSGLRNLGNSCYINSAIQIVGASSPLARIIMTRNYQVRNGSDGRLINSLSTLLNGVWGSDRKAVSPRELVHVIKENMSDLNNTDQHDVGSTGGSISYRAVGSDEEPDVMDAREESDDEEEEERRRRQRVGPRVRGGTHMRKSK